MTLDIYQVSALPPLTGALAAIATTVVLASGAITCFVRARRRDALARTAEASGRDTAPVLAEDRDVVLAGVVRHYEDHDVAVRVEVRQEGSEAESSGSWSHSWTEIDREIILAPFLLELADGTHVLVQPPKNVDVADKLDQKVWIDRNHRVLSAELVPGEKIFARGRLARSDRAVPGAAYRDNAWGWALQPARGQMLLSSEPLGHGLRQRASFHRSHAWLAVALFVVTQCALLPYYERVAGRTEVATVTNLGEYQTTDDDDNTTSHWFVVVRGEQVDVDNSDFAKVQKGDDVLVRSDVTWSRDWQLGGAPTIRWWHALLLVGTGLVFWVLYRGRRASSRPWFRRKVSESGSGRLPDSG